jgi:NADPH-dependent 2,4-dienoyl-CoA reductase/sulfur reductase-like enzyme
MPTASVPAACTVAIVGAGPAGMAAATLAADLGLEVVLIDPQPHPGGQIYRAIGAISPDRRLLPGDEYARYVANGTATTLRADQLLLHQGFVPDVVLSGAIGCDHEWDDALLCWKPRVDRWSASSMADVYIAGDAAGIAGARAAEHRGRLAALAVAAASGRIGAAARDREAAPHFAALARALRGRASGDALYRPAEQFRKAEGATIVCRCEKSPRKRSSPRRGAAPPARRSSRHLCAAALARARAGFVR